LKPRALNKKMKSSLKSVLKCAFDGYSADRVPRLGAALSYYTIFSAAPLIVIATAIAAFFLGAEAVNGQVSETLRGTLGDAGSHAVEDMVRGARNISHATLATVIGVVMLVFGASGVFIELQDSLNTIWNVKARPGRGLQDFVRDRLLSLGMVLGAGFLLLVSLLMSAILAGLSKYMQNFLPGGALPWEIANEIVSFLVISLIFAVMFKYLPDALVPWRGVWIGGFATGAMFVLGKTLIGLYLGRSAMASAYGAAGSLAIVLLWVYYVSQIFFFGAEFTKAYVDAEGLSAEPKECAVRSGKAQASKPNAAPQPERRSGRSEISRKVPE
jgi:membrane protein